LDKTLKKRWMRNWLLALLFPIPLVSLYQLPRYLIQWMKYKHLDGAETMNFTDSHPCLSDHVSHTPFDPHYFYQGAWLARCIAQTKPKRHVDIGSSVMMSGVLSGSVETLFVDYRPLLTQLENLESIAGNITNLELASDSVDSLSCLHVVEHIGLGRYGDTLDPYGSVTATRELERILKPGGRLYLSVPVGRERVCFNAHRVFAPDTMTTLLPRLKLLNFSYVSDDGAFYTDQATSAAAGCEYACGMYTFEK
jgi:hypothetical protein